MGNIMRIYHGISCRYHQQYIIWVCPETTQESMNSHFKRKRNVQLDDKPWDLGVANFCINPKQPVQLCERS